MNDSTEIHYASNLFLDALVNIKQDGSLSGTEEQALNERLIKALSEEPESPRRPARRVSRA
jgi:hypothetical protein